MSAPTAVFPDLWLGGADSALLSPWVTGSLLPTVSPLLQATLLWEQFCT